MSLLSVASSDRAINASGTDVMAPADPIVDVPAMLVSIRNMAMIGRSAQRLPPSYVFIALDVWSRAPTLGGGQSCLWETAQVLQRCSQASFDAESLKSRIRDGKVNYRPRWLEIAEADPLELSLADIKAIISGVSKELSASNFEYFDSWLKAARIEKMSFDAVTAMLRTSFMARNSLKQWHEFLDQSAKELNARGISTPSLERLRLAASS